MLSLKINEHITLESPSNEESETTRRDISETTFFRSDFQMQNSKKDRELHRKNTLSKHAIHQIALQNDQAILHWLVKETNSGVSYKEVHDGEVSKSESNHLHSSTSGGGMG